MWWRPCVGVNGTILLKHQKAMIILPRYRKNKLGITCGRCRGWCSRRSLLSWPPGSRHPLPDLCNTPQRRNVPPPYATPEHEGQTEGMGGWAKETGKHNTRKHVRRRDKEGRGGRGGGVGGWRGSDSGSKSDTSRKRKQEQEQQQQTHSKANQTKPNHTRPNKNEPK